MMTSTSAFDKSSSRTIRFSNSNPCPVCLTGTKGCSSPPSGLVFCRGESSDASGFRHVLQTGEWGIFAADDEPRRPRHSRAERRAGVGPTEARPLINWNALQRFHELNTREVPPDCLDRLDELSRTLSVSRAALEAIGTGYQVAEWREDRHGEMYLFAGAFTTPERDADSNIVGHAERLHDGTKLSAEGGRRGLTFALDCFEQAVADGYIPIPEGASCAAALLTVGVNNMARPGAGAGLEFLDKALGRMPDVLPIILGENDERNGFWPGRELGMRLARSLATVLGRPVHFALPPIGFKDWRNWINAMVPDLADAAAIAAARRTVLERLAAAEVVSPPPLPDVEDLVGPAVESLAPRLIADESSWTPIATQCPPACNCNGCGSKLTPAQQTGEVKVCGYSELRRCLDTGKVVAVQFECKSWNCLKCAPKKKNEWVMHLRAKMIRSGLEEFHFASFPDDAYDKKVADRIGAYLRYRKKPDRWVIESGGAHHVLATIPFPGSRPISKDDVVKLVADLLEAVPVFVDSRIPVSTSRSWELKRVKLAPWSARIGALPHRGSVQAYLDAMQRIELEPEYSPRGEGAKARFTIKAWPQGPAESIDPENGQRTYSVNTYRRIHRRLCIELELADGGDLNDILRGKETDQAFNPSIVI